MPGSDDQILRAGVAGTGQHLFLLGAGGDLACRMLFPSLFFLELDGLLPEGMRLTGVSRTPESSETFRNRLAASLSQHSRALANGGRKSALDRFLGRMDYQALDITDPESLRGLGDLIAPGAAPLYYFATSPSLFGPACRALKVAGLAGPEARIVLEKPLGRDLKSCRALHDMVGESFSESQILRVDHYLGKETVQNLIALRFGNALFEPLWNSRAIDHVQITIAETEKVGDRWPYYDEYGALRDMVQNHMLQLLCLVAMEAPSGFDPDAVRDEKVKVLRSLRPFTKETVAHDTVRGQYVAGVVEGGARQGYVEEVGKPTKTETFVAMKVAIDNWRWDGVPFFLRTGKNLPDRRTQIVVQFKPLPHNIFGPATAGELCANRLVIDLQPDEDISLTIMNKRPGLSDEGMRLQSLPLSLSFGQTGGRRRIAYEKLFLDAFRGDRTLFVRRDEVEQAWRFIDGVSAAWAEAGIDPAPYAAGTWGPQTANALISPGGRSWKA